LTQAAGPDRGPVAITVVVMAFNEARSLEPVVREIHGTLAGTGRPFEVLIVDDGSGDATAPTADRLSLELPEIRVVHHPQNQGLGGVYHTGLRSAKGDLVTFFPADGQFAASLLTSFIPVMADHDLALGYLAQPGGSFVARLLSGCERLVQRLLFGRIPRFQGILMLRRAILDRFPLRSAGRGWAVVLELIVRASRSGCRIAAVPIEVRPRMAGVSKVRNLATIWSNLRQLIDLRRQL
jgi:dolichol-phosphate mannosyltransferase